MGLDITAYRKISKIDCVFDADGEPIHPQTRGALEYQLRACVNHDFPGRAGLVEDQCIYAADLSFGFRAGSYGYYNRWRNDLSRLAGYPERTYKRDAYSHGQQRFDAGAWEAESGPFWELINFSDCEGVIGAEVSAKLAKDFADYQEKADAHESEDFRGAYAEWRKAFEMAADNGAVEFH